MPCSHHTSCSLLHRPTWATPGAAPREGQCKPRPGAAHTSHVLYGSFRPSFARTPPGAPTWALGLTGALSKVVLRPNDLQVPFSTTLGDPRALPTGGSLGSPVPPRSQLPHKNCQDSLQGDSDQLCRILTRKSLFS